VRETVGETPESVTLARIRTMLLVTLAVGIVGNGLELIFLGHVDSPTQWMPLVLLGVGAIVVAWHARRPGVHTVKALRVTMGAFVAVGLLGIGLHINGNVEFQRELDPSLGGIRFLVKTIAGATPVLAPGSLVLLGLVGLAHAYRHPQTASSADSR
jgi:hypothetical protein